jgi:hypothetical protein
MAINNTTTIDLSSLYEFRVSYRGKVEPVRNRRSAAKKINSLKAKGFTGEEIEVEHLVKGIWADDNTAAFALASKFALAAQKAGKTNNVSKVTTRSAMRDLAGALKLALGAGENINDNHYAAVQERMDLLQAAMNDVEESEEPEGEEDEA